jgi:hypothetical protein
MSQGLSIGGCYVRPRTSYGLRVGAFSFAHGGYPDQNPATPTQTTGEYIDTQALARASQMDASGLA